MSSQYYPVAHYRTSNVSQGGTTTQTIVSTRTEDRTVTDTKDLTDLTTRALTNNGTETIQADIGCQMTFIVTLPGKSPTPPRPFVPSNPNTT